MKDTKVNQTHENSWVRVALVLLVGLAAYSSAMKELNQAQASLTETRELVADVLAAVAPKGNPSAIIDVETCAPGTTLENGSKSDDLPRSGGQVAPGVALDLKRGDRVTNAEPEIGGEAHFVAAKESFRTDVNSVGIKVVEPQSSLVAGATHPMKIRSIHTRANSTLRVSPQAVGRPADTDILSVAVTSNMVSQVVRDLRQSLESKARSQVRTLDLPSGANVEVNGESFNGEINSEGSVKLANLARRKFVNGRIRVNGRVFVLKSLNANTNYRPAS